MSICNMNMCPERSLIFYKYLKISRFSYLIHSVVFSWRDFTISSSQTQKITDLLVYFFTAYKGRYMKKISCSSHLSKNGQRSRIRIFLSFILTIQISRKSNVYSNHDGPDSAVPIAKFSNVTCRCLLY